MAARVLPGPGPPSRARVGGESLVRSELDNSKKRGPGPEQEIGPGESGLVPSRCQRHPAGCSAAGVVRNMLSRLEAVFFLVAQIKQTRDLMIIQK